MADGWGPSVDVAQGTPAPTTGGWGPAVDINEKPKHEEPVGPMPGPLDAAWAGFKHSISDVGQSKEVIEGKTPTEAPEESNPAAQGFEWGDILQPTRGLSKIAYQTGASSPAIVGGVAGGYLGSLAGPVGTAVGGAGGAATGAALQTIGPAFAQELKKQPSDPDGAWTRAVESSLLSGTAAGASWALFPAKFFNGPVKNLAFQAFGVQPAVNVAQKATQNVISGDPITQGLGQGYAQGAVGTMVPAVGHVALRGRFGEPDTTTTMPTPAQSSAKATELRAQAQDAIMTASITAQPDIAEGLKQKAIHLNAAADYEEDRHQAPARAQAKIQHADFLDQQRATQGYPALAQEVMKGQATEFRNSARQDLFYANVPPPLEKNTGLVGKIKQTYLDNIAPEMTSETATNADALIRGYNSRRSQIEASLQKLGNETYHYPFNKVPFDQQLRFATAYETGMPLPADLVAKYPWMDEAYPTYRRQYLEDFQNEKEMGSKAYFLKNYMGHLWKDRVQAEKLFDPQNLSHSMGDTWFQKARTYDLMELGISHGLEPKYENIQDIVTARRISGADMINKMQLLQELKANGAAIELDKAPAHIKNPNITGDPYHWQPVNAPDRQQWLIAPDAQALWKNGVESRGLWDNPTKMGDAFRGWMALKSYWVPIKLALSAFHFVHVAHINAVNNMSRAVTEAFGHPFTGQQSLIDRFKAIPQAMLQSVADPFFRSMPYLPFRGKELMRSWATAKENQTPAQAADVKLMTEMGISAQQSEQLRMQGERGFWDAWGKNRYLAALPKGVALGYERTVGAMFEKWIPSLKVAAAQREAEALFRRRPDLLTDDMNRKIALSAIGKQIDSRFGEMFYGGLFWNRTLKDASIGSFLSLGWNLGFLREFGGGTFEPIVRRMLDAPNPSRKLIRDTTNKTTNMLLYGLTAATINGVMNYAFTGDQPSGMDYIFPRLGGLNPDGSPRRLTNAFYTREVPMAMKNIEDRNSVAGGLWQMMYHKMMYDPFIEMANNKDYFGYQIRDENSPAYQQVWQMAKHLVGDQLNPMSIAGAKRALELSGKPHNTVDVLKQLGDRDVYLPLLGFGPAPAYASKSAMQNRIQYLFKETVAPERKSFDVSTNSKARSEARMGYVGAQQRHDQAGVMKYAQELQKLGVSTKEINKLQPGGPTDYMFGRLQALDQAPLMKQMTPEEFKHYYPLSSYAPKKGKPARHSDPEITALVRKYYSQP